MGELIMAYAGELAALATVLCWTCSVQFFEAASKIAGAVSVNVIRIFVALSLFCLLHLWRYGVILPLDFPPHAWLFLGLSGIIGFFIGDIFLFEALIELGPRVTMLIQSLAAPTAAVIGWIFLDEIYIMRQWLGMSITLAGVSAVILERSRRTQPAQKLRIRRISFYGTLYAFLAMLSQAGGLVLSKIGMQDGERYLDAFAATQIRALAAFCCFLLFVTVTGRWSRLAVSLRDPRVVSLTSTGAAIGPFLGVSLALLSLHYLSAGVAGTFFSLVPVCIIPFAVYLHKEHVSLTAVLGAVTAVFGVYLLSS